MLSSSHASQINVAQNAEEKISCADLRACIQKIATKISQKHRLKDNSIQSTLYDINLNVLKENDIGEGYISYLDNNIGDHCIENPHSAVAVSLHVYPPKAHHCNTWEV